MVPFLAEPVAKKTKKQKQRTTPARRVAARPASSAPEVSPVTPGGDVPDDQNLDDGGDGVEMGAVASPPSPASRRRVERVAPASAAAAARGNRRGRFTGSSAALVSPLDSEDPAIPYDRVPYVPADLRRVLLIGALMILLIIVADIVVTNFVK